MSLNNESSPRARHVVGWKRCVPLSGSIALTHRCNLRCLHCRAASGCSESSCGGRPPEAWVDGGEELSTERILAALDGAAAAGCLFMLLTGGEPLLRRDFVTIYTHAKRLGMLVTVFTNGTLVDDRILSLFVDLPPKGVEISIYGASAKTHDAVTGLPGSFDRCLRTVERFQERKITIGLTSLLMKKDIDEFPAIMRLAKLLGVTWRLDPASQSHQAMHGAVQALTPTRSVGSRGAGGLGFHISPAGMLQPCLLITEIQYELRAGSFRSGWDDITKRVRRHAVCSNLACHSCSERSLCGCYPGFLKMETGHENKASPYLCAIGRNPFETLFVTN